MLERVECGFAYVGTRRVRFAYVGTSRVQPAYVGTCSVLVAGDIHL